MSNAEEEERAQRREQRQAAGHRREPLRDALAVDSFVQEVLQSDLPGPLKRSLLAQRMRQSSHEQRPDEDDRDGAGVVVYATTVVSVALVLLTTLSLVFVLAVIGSDVPLLFEWVGGGSLVILAGVTAYQAWLDWDARRKASPRRSKADVTERTANHTGRSL